MSMSTHCHHEDHHEALELSVYLIACAARNLYHAWNVHEASMRIQDTHVMIHRAPGLFPHLHCHVDMSNHLLLPVHHHLA